MFFQNTERSYLRMLAELILLAIAIFALGSLLVSAQDSRPGARPGVQTFSDEEPLLRDYRGVTLGMAAADARRKLGEPADKGDTQDFYQLSETESVQIFYDAAGKVSAVSVHYFGAGAAPPTPQALFGTDAEPRADGSLYKLVKYARAGYWVSYNRTAGDEPIVTVSMKRDAP